MKKLRFVSVIIVLLLFCPFIKQCDGMNKRVDREAVADSTAVISNNGVYRDSIKPITEERELKEDTFNELKIYFTEDSENVFEIASKNGKSIIEGVIIEKKSIINDRSFIIVFSFCLLSISLIISSLLTLIYSFLENYNKIRLLTILNITFILFIVIVFYFSVLYERFGQIKIGFYLLLLSNSYMLYVLKQKKEQIQH